MKRIVDRKINLLDKSFGKLKVERFIDLNKYRCARWDCLCECGKRTIATTSHLTSGSKKSCGCIGRRKTHGLRSNPLYYIYRNLKSRCENKKDLSFKNYGARGIKCEWGSFESFYKNMNKGYDKGLTIERIDNNGNYAKINCRWATREEQANNTRRNIFLEYQGERKTINQWSKKLNIKYWTLLMRIKRGWTVDRAFNCEIFNR